MVEPTGLQIWWRSVSETVDDARDALDTRAYTELIELLIIKVAREAARLAWAAREAA